MVSQECSKPKKLKPEDVYFWMLRPRSSYPKIKLTQASHTIPCQRSSAVQVGIGSPRADRWRIGRSECSQLDVGDGRVGSDFREGSRWQRLLRIVLHQASRSGWQKNPSADLVGKPEGTRYLRCKSGTSCSLWGGSSGTADSPARSVGICCLARPVPLSASTSMPERPRRRSKSNTSFFHF